MKINEFAVDEKAELNGVWKNIGNGARLLVARDNNTKFTNLLRERVSHHPSAIAANDLSTEESEKLLIAVEAETLLLGWEGLEDTDGTFPTYSVNNAIIWLTKYKELRKLVITIAENVDNYREKQIKEIKDDLKK